MKLLTKITVFISILLMLVALETDSSEKGFYKTVTNENTKKGWKSTRSKW